MCCRFRIRMTLMMALSKSCRRVAISEGSVAQNAIIWFPNNVTTWKLWNKHNSNQVIMIWTKIIILMNYIHNYGVELFSHWNYFTSCQWRCSNKFNRIKVVINVSNKLPCIQHGTLYTVCVLNSHIIPALRFSTTAYSPASSWHFASLITLDKCYIKICGTDQTRA